MRGSDWMLAVDKSPGLRGLARLLKGLMAQGQFQSRTCFPNTFQDALKLGQARRTKRLSVSRFHFQPKHRVLGLLEQVLF